MSIPIWRDRLVDFPRRVWEKALEILKDGHTFYDDCAVTVYKGWSLASRIDQCEFRASSFFRFSHDFEALADIWNLPPCECDHDSPTWDGSLDVILAE